MPKNACAKTRPAEKPYEIWTCEDHPEYGGKWTWYVLKKWQSDDEKPYARWFCLVKTPIVPQGELGDVYVQDIKSCATQTFKEVPTA